MERFGKELRVLRIGLWDMTKRKRSNRQCDGDFKRYLLKYTQESAGDATFQINGFALDVLAGLTTWGSTPHIPNVRW